MWQVWGRIVVLGALTLAGPPALAETRVALVVGNGAYQTAPALANPVNDAHDVATALKAAGFTVIETDDAGKRQFDEAIRDFANHLANADVALLYYAGHGLQVGLQNYLVPIDAKLEHERDLEFEAVKLDVVLHQMEIDRDGKITIVILDACRNNPLSRNLARSMGSRSTAVGSGLAPAATGLGTFIAYSTQPGNVAVDGDGRNSPFAKALVTHMSAKGRNLTSTMIEVRKDVVAATGGQQVPWDHSSLTRDFYFQPGEADLAADRAVDVTALQERLNTLEAAAKKQQTAAIPAVPAVKPADANTSLPNFVVEDNLRIEGLKINERRQPGIAACQDWCEQDVDCVAFQFGKQSQAAGMCQLYDRIDARLADKNWRSGVRNDTPVPDAPAPAPTAVSHLPGTFKVRPTRKEPGFDIYEGLTAIGDSIKMSATDSSAGCQAVCRATPGCTAAVYSDFFRGKNVACMIYGEISDVIKNPVSRMMVRNN